LRSHRFRPGFPSDFARPTCRSRGRLQAQLQKSPNSAALAFLLGQAQLRNSQQADAEQSFARAAQLEPANVAPIAALATLQAIRGETDAAILSYKRAIPLAPTNSQLIVSLGALYETKGNWQQAQSTYQQALSVQPDNGFAANNLAYLLLEHGGDVNVALSLAQTVARVWVNRLTQPTPRGPTTTGLPVAARSSKTVKKVYQPYLPISLGYDLSEIERPCSRRVPLKLPSKRSRTARQPIAQSAK
jgi:tetratricopeptide (TPR) repeat protein